MTLQEKIRSLKHGSRVKWVRKLAKYLECTEACIYNYARGFRTPSIDKALKIQKFTRNQVKIDSWTHKDKKC